MKPEQLVEEIEAGPRGSSVAAFFDLDGTLVHGFTATHVLRHQVRKGQVAMGDLGRLMLTAMDGTLGGDPTRLGSVSVGTMRGLMEDQLLELGERLFVQKIAGTIRPQARAIVKAHQRMGHTVVMASAATRFQVMPVARDLGIDHVLCTELEVEDGVLTGQLLGKFLWGEPKAQAVRRFAREHDIDLPASYGYANGDEDVPFLASVGRPHPIAPHRALLKTAQAQGWRVLDVSEPLRSGVREVLGTVGALASFNAGMISGAAVSLLKRDRQAGMNVGVPLACDAALAAAGVKYEVTGAEHLAARPAIVIANHRSGLDMLIMGSLLRTDFTGVAKAELRKDPTMMVAGFLFNPVYVDRGDPAQSRAALAGAVERIQSGTSVLIFPEGTRMPTPEPGPFKKGAFHMAMQAGVPIVPVVIRNAGELMGPSGIATRPGTVDVHVLEPIDTSDWQAEDLGTIVPAVRQLFVDTLEKWPA